MGTVEIALLIKYGIPLAVKILNLGESSDKTEEIVVASMSSLVTSPFNMTEALVAADDKQAKVIVDAMFRVATGVRGSIGSLFRLLADREDGI